MKLDYTGIANPFNLTIPALYGEEHIHPSVAHRCAVERMVVASLVTHMAKAGWTVAYVNDGEERHKTQCLRDVLEAVFGVDESRICFEYPGAQRCVVVIVLGNDGWDAIADASAPMHDPGGFTKALDSFKTDPWGPQ